MNEEEIIRSTFAIIDDQLRSASIAQVGGFRPSDEPFASYFGGRFYGLPGEEYPTCNGRVLSALLQVNLEELPFVPAKLHEIRFITVFVDEENLPFGNHNGDGWVIRTYDSLSELILLPESTYQTNIKPFPIRWSLIEGDAPDWTSAWEYVNPTGFLELSQAIELFSEKYQTRQGTKIGGWPHYLQDDDKNLGDFVFQIDSEYKANWMWGDAGIAYFFKDETETWFMDWDSL